MTIQIVLTFIFALLLIQVIAEPFFSKLIKLAALLFIAAAVLFVFSPSLANDTAHVLGVGRGADLFSYLSISGGAMILFRLYLRMRTLELKQIELIRELAIQKYYLEQD